MTISNASLLGATLTISALVAFTVPASADVTVYLTRHAEKQTVLEEVEGSEGVLAEVCGEDKCAEELNPLGKMRAKLLADWFEAEGITENVTHVFSSHKKRTLQTVQEIAADAGLSNDKDMVADGVQQLPAMNTTELDDGTGSEGTKATVAPTVAALKALEDGSVAVVAGHSGTIYKIIEGLGVDTSSEEAFPRDVRKGKEGKVPTFGDVWKLMIDENGKATFESRVNLQPGPLVAR